MWNDDAIAASLIGVNSFYFFIGAASLFLILLAVLLETPSKPLWGDWPTHGWYFQLPDVLMPLVVVSCLGVRSTLLVKAVLVLVMAVTALDVYALITILWWLYAFLWNTLTPAARAHQTLFQTLTFIPVLFGILFFHLSALTALFHVNSVLPDLKVEYGLGHRDQNGDFIDYTEDDENRGPVAES